MRVFASLLLVLTCACGSVLEPSATATDGAALCDAPPTWDGFALPFFEARCLACHSESRIGSARLGAPDGMDFDTEELAAAQAHRIRSSVLDAGTMPPGVALSACEKQQLDAWLDGLAPCAPSCDGRSCGDDGCGGSCGGCASGEFCDAAGACVPGSCTPDCTGTQCGDDGCGGTCGTCAAGEACDEGACVCVPSCEGRACGGDGCGGSCGACPGNQLCNTRDGICAATCTPDCTGRTCGDDGCGGSCGTCEAGDRCDESGACVCAPSCAGRMCGTDGCGGTCGACPSGQSCDDAAGTCSWPTYTLAQDVMPIFSQSCTAQCHDATRPSADLNLSTADAAWAGLVNAAASCGGRTLVVPGNPDASYLVNKLTGSGMCGGNRMPSGGRAVLTEAQMTAVRGWIGGGALR